jgi:hypothetical protein
MHQVVLDDQQTWDMGPEHVLSIKDERPKVPRPCFPAAVLPRPFHRTHHPHPHPVLSPRTQPHTILLYSRLLRDALAWRS